MAFGFSNAAAPGDTTYLVIKLKDGRTVSIDESYEVRVQISAVTGKPVFVISKPGVAAFEVTLEEWQAAVVSFSPTPVGTVWDGKNLRGIDMDLTKKYGGVSWIIDRTTLVGRSVCVWYAQGIYLVNLATKQSYKFTHGQLRDIKELEKMGDAGKGFRVALSTDNKPGLFMLRKFPPEQGGDSWYLYSLTEDRIVGAWAPNWFPNNTPFIDAVLSESNNGVSYQLSDCTVIFSGWNDEVVIK